MINDVGLNKGIISDRDPKLISEFWQRLNNLMGTKLQYSPACHPEIDGLTGRMIQILENMNRSQLIEKLKVRPLSQPHNFDPQLISVVGHRCLNLLLKV